jgi:hypothetical protein
MGANFTPNVNSKEDDKSLTVQKSGATNVALVVAAQWGPCNEIKIVSNELELVKQFSKPIIGDNEKSWMPCADFIKYYSDTMHVVRPIDDNASNSNNATLLVDKTAGSLGGAWTTGNGASKPLKINEDDSDPTVTFIETRRLTLADASSYSIGDTPVGDTSGFTGTIFYIDVTNDQIYLTASTGEFTDGEGLDAATTTVTTDDGTGYDQVALIYAKYPGTAGNNIKVAISDSDDFSTALIVGSTTFEESFDTKPYKILQVVDSTVFTVGDSVAGESSGTGTIMRIKDDLIYIDVLSGTFTAEGIDDAITYVASVTTISAVYDELAIVVIFENDIVEKYIVSTYTEATNLNGERSFIETYLENNSNYINSIVDETGTVTIADFNGSFQATPLTLGKSDFDLTAVQNASDIIFDDQEYNIRYVGDFHDLDLADVKTLQGTMRAKADNIQKKLAVINLPTSVINVASFSIATVLTHLAPCIGSSYVCVADNWKKVYDKYNKKRYFIPCTGDVLGVNARTVDRNNVWTAPFGNVNGQVANVESFYHKTTLAIRDILYKNGINSLFRKRNKGNVLWGQKTLANAASSRSRINVRMNLIALRVDLEDVLDDFISSESNAETWRSITNTCDEGYLKPLSGKGAFDLSNGEGHKFVCNGTNNTADVIDAYKIVCDLAVKPIKSAEIIDFNITILSSGTNIEEI